MKKTKYLLFLVLFSIILSFSSFCYADENISVTGTMAGKNGDLGSTYLEGSLTPLQEGGGSFTGTAYGEASALGFIGWKQYSAIGFQVDTTGVYSIDVEGLGALSSTDLAYVLRTYPDGKVVRLAAYQNDKGEYKLVNANDSSRRSNVDVILQAGQRYIIELSENSRTPTTQNDSILYTDQLHPKADFFVKIKYNEEMSGYLGRIFQSQVPSTKRTDPFGINNEELENVSPEYALDVYTPYEPDYTGDWAEELIEAGKEYLINPLEETICELSLGFGDFLTNLLNGIVGKEVTIGNLVYNKVDSLNPNFFDSSLDPVGLNASIKTGISNWYTIFKMVALSIYIVALLVIGIRVLYGSTADGMEKGKIACVDWLKGIALFVVVPYLVKLMFTINESFVNMLSSTTAEKDYAVGGKFYDTDEWSLEEIEFRSPEFISRFTGKEEAGSDEASNAYAKRLTKYREEMDLMRIMRAYAGVTKKIIYVVIWFILLGQLLAFIVQYYKRYFMIAFLIAAFPMICIFHGISIIRGKPHPPEFGNWAKELLSNIFMQTIQALIYTVITVQCVQLVMEDMTSPATLNWVLIILVINFVSQGEKILKRVINAFGIGSGETVQGTGKAGQGIRGAYSTAKSRVNEFRGIKKKKDDDDKDDL